MSAPRCPLPGRRWDVRITSRGAVLGEVLNERLADPIYDLRAISRRDV